MALKENFASVKELEQSLSQPHDDTCKIVSGLKGDIMMLGAGGKIGPTLCQLLRAAAPNKTIYAVDLFPDKKIKTRLEKAGIKTIVANLLDRAGYAKLPRAENIYYLAGMKFGASSKEPLTWAMNAHLPALVCDAFPKSRIAAFSTGNIYPFVPLWTGGAEESVPPRPIGDYAQSCLGRERIFQFFSLQNKTPIVLVRLNYANECRYGIVVDLTQKVLHGTPIDVSMGYVNIIWQGDVNNYVAKSITLASSPASFINIAGPETVGVRTLCETIGAMVGKEPKFEGQEADTALLSNSGKCFDLYGYPTTPLNQIVRAAVNWVKAGKEVLGKPTKFQVRDGKF